MCADQTDAIDWVALGLLGESAAIHSLKDELLNTCGPGLDSVLIHGETGTGKEVVSRALHKLSERSQAKFIPVSCASVPGTLFASKFFGHRRGAFTGAEKDFKGVFEQANNGTILLDDVDTTSPDDQAKFLRVLDQREVLPIGAKDPVKVNVLVVAATNADLVQRVAEGSFREDLYYRLNQFELFLPPLRSRSGDIRILADHLMRIASKKTGKEISTISPAAIALLEAHGWPGNVRELKNYIGEAVKMAIGPELEVSDFRSLERRSTPAPVVVPVAASSDVSAPCIEAIADIAYRQLCAGDSPLAGIARSSIRVGDLADCLAQGIAVGFRKFLQEPAEGKTAPRASTRRNLIQEYLGISGRGRNPNEFSRRLIELCREAIVHARGEQ